MSERKYESMNHLPMPSLHGYHGEYTTLDPRIKNLVKVINGLGYNTMGSCEGHLDDNRNPYPWITVMGLRASRQLAAYIGLFNSSSEIKWTSTDIIPYKGKDRPFKAKTQEELTGLQQSAQALAEFLFERYLHKKS